MTKSEELKVLTEAAERLGPDSYCGPWLLDVIPEIKADMDADVSPVPRYSVARCRAEQIAASIIAGAKHDAEKIRVDAECAAVNIRDDANTARINVGAAIRRAAECLGYHITARGAI